VFGASKITDDKYSAELNNNDITGLPENITSIEQTYDMFNTILDGDDKNIVITMSVTDNVTDPILDDTISTKKPNANLLCVFIHKLYGFKISFKLNKIRDDIIIYDIKSEKRLRLLEEQMNGVVFLKGCDKVIQMDCVKLVLYGKTILDNKIDGLFTANGTLADQCNVSTVYNSVRQDILPRWSDDGSLHCTYGAVFAMMCLMTQRHNFNGISIRPLALLTHIKILKIINNDNIVDITPIGELKTLTDITISYCIGVEDISCLGELKELLTIDLTGCKRVINVADLCDLQKLDKLCLTGTSVTNVLSLKNLHRLAITGI
jgi:Leucine-rich repeat (LRR) protein